MASINTRVAVLLLVTAALVGLLTIPTDQTLGIAMIFLVILASGHALLTAGLRPGRQSIDGHASPEE